MEDLYRVIQEMMTWMGRVRAAGAGPGTGRGNERRVMIHGIAGWRKERKGLCRVMYGVSGGQWHSLGGTGVVAASGRHGGSGTLWEALGSGTL